MIKRSFVGLIKPRLTYPVIELTPLEPEKISIPKHVTLLLNEPFEPFVQKKSALLKTGDAVKTGQKLVLYEDSTSYVVSTVTGTVSSLSSFLGDFGRSYTSIEIEVAEHEEIDEQFTKMAKEPSLETVKVYLSFVPGNLPASLFSNTEASTPVETIVVCAVDGDLLIKTNQHILVSENKAIKNGVQILRHVTGVENIIMVAPEHLMQDAAVTGTEVRAVASEYPSSLPHLIMRDVLNKIVPAGKTCEDLGVYFVSAEAVASMGKAFSEGRIPVLKTFTLIKKDGSSTIVSARIGTPIHEVFSAFDVTINEKDRIILGGPMTGSTVYSENHPIQPDTDAICVQGHKDLALVSDYPCINCGECIPICPAKIQVNMLVRLLEVAQYQEAADRYDLYSCIECGLCSFICVSRMPILQYIKLAKHELDRIRKAEAIHV